MLSLVTLFSNKLQLYVNCQQLKPKELAKMNERVPKERLGTSGFNDICKNDPNKNKTEEAMISLDLACSRLLED